MSLEEMAALWFSPQLDDRLQRLMDRNTDGKLSPAEIGELNALVDLSELIGLVRCKSRLLLDGISPYQHVTRK
jgi:hypothetical protein